MKKLLFAVTLMFVGTVAQAACFGPVCYDDTGLYLQMPPYIPTMTLAAMNAATPKAAGLLVIVSDGLQASVCVSSGTGRGAFIVASASSTAVLGGLVGHCN